ncbi:hypothetical protein FOA52_007028 [Chlamydomonas sp. UWO 241]|nr:hypothetical protein FOA52_007028 [Chlamydomonas sp. UWO 241]
MSHSEHATSGRRKRDGATEPPREGGKKKSRTEPLLSSTHEWDAAVKQYRAEIKEEDPENYDLFRCLGEQGCDVLKGMGLSKQEHAWLRRCTTVTDASVEWVECNDVEDFVSAARIWAVDGSGCVDVMHEFDHKDRLFSHGCAWLSAEVWFSINGSRSQQLVLAVRDTGPEFNWREEAHFALEKSHIDAIRTTLFPQGYDEHYSGRVDITIRHCQDGKVGVLLRRLCGAASEKDLTWKPIDWDARIAEDKEWRRKRRQEDKEGRGEGREEDGKDESGDEGKTGDGDQDRGWPTTRWVGESGDEESGEDEGWGDSDY